MIKLLGVIGIPFVFSGCLYTSSALEYAKEGTARVEKAYTAKAEMTKALTDYLKEVNKDCGVTSKFVDGVPTTTVKECVRASDVMASVDRVEVVKPQQVNDMLSSAGDFVMKSTNLLVPVAGVYYNYRTHDKSMDASIANTASNNAMQTSMFNAYTGNFQNSVSTSNVSSSTNVTTTTDSEYRDYSDITTTTTMGDLNASN